MQCIYLYPWNWTFFTKEIWSLLPSQMKMGLMQLNLMIQMISFFYSRICLCYNWFIDPVLDQCYRACWERDFYLPNIALQKVSLVVFFSVNPFTTTDWDRFRSIKKMNGRVHWSYLLLKGLNARSLFVIVKYFLKLSMLWISSQLHFVLIIQPYSYVSFLHCDS